MTAASEDRYDIFVIGGGINGCGIARDAAGRGYSVFLAEMNDLASGTSSGSTKLIHGGLRYLEYYEFRLVREALKEREVLWAMAPHIIWPLRFVLPHHKGLRPAWLLRLGMFLYDHIGGRKRLPPAKTIDMRKDVAGKPLKPMFLKAFEYSDCWVNDARLVVLNARDAADRGAVIRPRTRVTGARRDAGTWSVTVEDIETAKRETVRARLLVNAAGPWVDDVLAAAVGDNDPKNVRLVQGSHIVVNRLFEHDRCYMFQNADGRIIFAIPYEEDFTLIGTTDRDYTGAPGEAAISESEIDYLCAAASEYFIKPVTRDDIVWTYSGVRPLYDDGATMAQEATRDYVLKQEGTTDEGVLLNIFGGKITTYRRLSEAVVGMIEDAIGARGEPWTRAATLPGGDFPQDGYDTMVEQLQARYPYLDRRAAARYVRLYGTYAEKILAGTSSEKDLGRHFGGGFHEAEARYLVKYEWAACAEDLVYRRTKAALRMTAKEIAALDRFVAKLRATI